MAIGSFISGFVGGAVDTVKGLGRVIAHPIDTAEGIGNAVSHPVETYEGIKAGVKKSFSDNPAEASGRAVFEVVSLFGPGALTKVGKISKLTKGAEIAAEAGKAGKAAEVAAEAGKAGKAAEVAAEAGKAGKTAEVAAEAGKTGKAAEAGKATETVSSELLEGTKSLPQAGSESFGHGARKHIKTPEQVEELRKTIKPKETVTWFPDTAAMNRAAGQAPEALKDVLASNPAKKAEFEAFLKNPQEGAAFGFRFEVKGQESLGKGMKKVGGEVQEFSTGNTAYIQYKWAKGKNGVMEPQVFTVYPVAAK